MKIGFDVDDITVDFMPSLIDYYNSKYHRNLKFEDIISFRLWEVGIGKNKEEAIKIVYDFYSSEFYKKMPFVDGAKEGILKLLQKNEGSFISARYSTVRDSTRRFLINEFPKSEVFYSRSYIDPGRTKAEICREIGVDVMIEDHLETAIECQTHGIRTLLFDKPWNRKGNGDLERAYNWKEILKKLNY